MLQLHSILKLVDPDTDWTVFVVCETKEIEAAIIRRAGLSGLEVSNAIASEDSENGIFLNEIPANVTRAVKPAKIKPRPGASRKTTFINESADMDWLFQTHLKNRRDRRNYNSAVIYGNEDSPDRIVLYKQTDPAVDAEPALDLVYK